MICKSCGVEKPRDSFYESNQATCKECVKARSKLRRQTNPKVQEYDRERGNRQSLEYTQAYRGANLKKYKATTWINNAIRDGRLIKAENCEVCNGTFQIEGHHDDYDQPKVVRWLCSRCHSLWHSAFGEAKNPF